MLVVEAVDAPLRGLDERALAHAEVADADLHQAADIGQPRHYIVEDARVRPAETLEFLAQIRVRVDLQDAHAAMTLRKFGDERERARMVATEQRGNRAAVEDALGLARDIAVDALARSVHDVDRLRMRAVARRCAAGLDDRLGRAARRLRQRRDVLRNRQHRESRLPDRPVLQVFEVDLLARLEHRRGASRGAREVAGGRVEGHGDHDKFGIFDTRVEAEQAVASRRRVGVEVGGGGV